ncbi:MAG: hypothetical protein ABF747_08170 [Bifidobacterium sp.]|uniref:Uncharacterized protein n=1 Tax=Bifidobacterium fermentum TaxID=3059035 RepID=A0AB39UM76_9BIFI
MASDKNIDTTTEHNDEDDFKESEQNADTYGWGDEEEQGHGHLKMFCIIAVLAGIALFFYFKYCRDAKVEIPDNWQKTIDRGNRQVRKAVNQTLSNAGTAVDQTVRSAGSAVDGATSKIRDSVQQILD